MREMVRSAIGSLVRCTAGRVCVLLQAALQAPSFCESWCATSRTNLELEASKLQCKAEKLLKTCGLHWNKLRDHLGVGLPSGVRVHCESDVRAAGAGCLLFANHCRPMHSSTSANVKSSDPAQTSLSRAFGAYMYMRTVGRLC